MEEIGDLEAMDRYELPDIDDPGMTEDTNDFHREVDEAMGDHANLSGDTEMVAMMDVLQTLGVDVEDANRCCARAVRTAQNMGAPSFIEAYGTGRIVESANGVLRNLNIKGHAVFDLRTRKGDGTPWNFSKASDRKEALRYVKEKRPTWIVGCPPCSAFTRLQGLNFRKMAPERIKTILHEGRRHLHFVIS